MKPFLRIFCLAFIVTVIFPSTGFTQWKKTDLGTLAWLRAIFFVNQSKGWIIGSKGVFLTTEDGGRTWTSSKRNTEDNLRDIYFTDEKNGWLLAEKNIYGTASISPSYILKTADGGKTWQRIKFTGEGKERLIKIFFSREGKGYAVGEAGTFFQMLDDRHTWKREPVPVMNMLTDGEFIDDLRGFLVGGNGVVLFTDDGGTNWNPAKIYNGFKSKLNSVFFINRNVGWTVGANGKIYSTNNGGKLWYPQNSKTEINLTDIFFINTAEGWAIGEDGTILHTTTAGNIWTFEESPVTHKLERIFSAGRDIWIVGFGGTILRLERQIKNRNNQF